MTSHPVIKPSLQLTSGTAGLTSDFARIHDPAHLQIAETNRKAAPHARCLISALCGAITPQK